MNLRQLASVSGLLALLTGLTGAIGLLQPAFADALRRDPAALASGQWWRLLSPLLVRVDGWLALVLVVLGTVAAGLPIEQRVGWPRMLGLFLVGGVVGQAAGYFWDPFGAGSSVAVLGLFAGLWVLLLRPSIPLSSGERQVAAAGLCALVSLVGITLAPDSWAPVIVVIAVGVVGFRAIERFDAMMVNRVIALSAFGLAIVLTILRDNHGPAILAAGAVGLLPGYLVDRKR